MGIRFYCGVGDCQYVLLIYNFSKTGAKETLSGSKPSLVLGNLKLDYGAHLVYPGQKLR